MFEQLFKTEETVLRYRNAPLASSRADYVEKCSEQGWSRSVLLKIVATHLHLARDLSLEPERRVSLEEVQCALGRWSGCPAPENGNQGSRSWKTRRRHAVAWLEQAGLLEPEEAPAPPHAAWTDDFAHWLQHDCGRSVGTVRVYCGWVGRFLGQFPEAEVITVAHLDSALQEKFACKSLSRHTMRIFGTALRTFFRYADPRGWCEPGLADAVLLPRIPTQAGLPSAPSPEEIERLLGSVDGDRPAHLRDRAILLLLQQYGLRAGEVSGLRLDDIDWDQSTLVVQRPKTGSHDRFPLTDTAGQALARYISEARPRRRCREIFLKLTAPPTPLSGASVSTLVYRRMRAIGVTRPRCGAHSLRHAFARRLLSKGFAMHEIGDCLGHRSPDSTAYYAKVDLAALRCVADIDLEGLA